MPGAQELQKRLVARILFRSWCPACVAVQAKGQHGLHVHGETTGTKMRSQRGSPTAPKKKVGACWFTGPSFRQSGRRRPLFILQEQKHTNINFLAAPHL